MKGRSVAPRSIPSTNIMDTTIEIEEILNL